MIVATGGLPDTGFLEPGEDLVVVELGHPGRATPGPARGAALRRQRRPSRPAGGRVARRGRARGSRSSRPSATSRPRSAASTTCAYSRCFQAHGVRITINMRLRAVRRDGNRLARGSAATTAAHARSGWSTRSWSSTARCRSTSSTSRSSSGPRNRGEVDYRALIAGRPQAVVGNPDGRFQLFRIGDAVASRNIHAAIYDALRLCKDL